MIKIVSPHSTILTPRDQVDDIPATLEWAGRTCYKSHDRAKSGSAEKFVRMICRNHHESVLEHCSITAEVTCSRACSHQLVRHRLASYSQESQRYVNYKNKGFEFICPPVVGLVAGKYDIDENAMPHKWFKVDGCRRLIPGNRERNWLDAIDNAICSYGYQLTQSNPEDARYLLPNATCTRVVVTANLRMWRHIFRERALNPKAQWEIRWIFVSLYKTLCQDLPCVFEDLKEECHETTGSD
jgi:thymidylate synthase (FAD)